MNKFLIEIFNTFFLWIVIAIVAIFRILKARWKDRKER